MSWFTELADKAENLLNNLDEKTGVALRNHNILKSQHGKRESERNESPPWKQKTSRRSISKNVLSSISKANNYVPEVLTSPLLRPIPTSHSPTEALTGDIDGKPVKQKKSSHHDKTYDLKHSPRISIEELKSNDASTPGISLKNRRLSLPDNLESTESKYVHDKCQNMASENTVLKNELNLMNNEVTQMRYKLRTEEEAIEITNIREEKLMLEENVMELKQKNEDILSRMNTLETERDEKQKENLKYEKDLKYTQNVLNELQMELTKTKEECQRLQTDWDAYKLRVKNMLIAKDNEIKTLHIEPRHTEETKTFTVELDKLRSDREELIEDLNHIRNEYNDMKLCMEELESKTHSTEKIVAALRDALKEERIAKNRLEVDYATLSKEHKKFQLESSHIIANLREELAEKERVTNIKYSQSDSDQSSDINSLNVADCDTMLDTLANKKIQCLTDTLVAKQRKIDSLIAENNMMRIQMEKLEAKHKNDIAALKTNHSVVHVNDNEVVIRDRMRSRKYIPESIFSRTSVTIGTYMRRHPLFRMFVVIYMVGLHLWVLLILLTYSPDGQNYKQSSVARH